MTTERVSIIIRARDFASRALSRLGVVGRRVDRVFNGIKRTFRAVAFGVGALTGAVVGSVVALGRLATKGGDVLNVQRAFERATGNSTAAIKLLREATFGLIDDFELMKGLNQAITLGSAKTTEQFAELATTAISLGRALGIDAAFALNSLNTGIARQSRLFLDNIGIVLSVTEANENYAASIGKTAAQLTDAQKRDAFRTEALRKARDAISKLGGVELIAADAVRQAAVSVKNFGTNLAALAAKSPFVEEFFSKIGSLADDFATILQGDEAQIRRAFGLVGTIAGNSFMLGFLEVIRALPELMQDAAKKGVFRNLPGFMQTLFTAPGTAVNKGLASVIAPQSTVDALRSIIGDSIAELGSLTKAAAGGRGPGLGGGGGGLGGGAAGGGGLPATPGGVRSINDPFQISALPGRAPGALRVTQPGAVRLAGIQAIANEHMEKWIDLQEFARDVIASTLTPQERYNQLTERITEAYGLGLLSAEEFTRAMEEAGAAMEDTGEEARIGAAEIVTAFGRAAEEIVNGLRGGGGFFSGLLSIGGGIAAAATGGVAGAAILAGSGVAAALSRPGRGAVDVNIEDISDRAVEKQRQRQGPDTVSVKVVTADGTVLADVQKRLDEVARLTGEDILAGVRVSG